MKQSEHKPTAGAIIKIKKPDSIFSGDATYTTLFLMPAFDLLLRPGWFKHCVNCYIDDAGIKHYFKRPLFLLIQYYDRKDVLELISYLKEKKSYVHSYLVGYNSGIFFRMFVFECPEKYKPDYDLFLRAKYSKFSDDFKNKFTQTVQTPDGKHEENPLYGAMFKTKHMKDWIEKQIGEPLESGQEYFPKLKPTYEVFRYNQS